MVRFIKHTIWALLCLLVIFGVVGTHFYTFTCSQEKHSMKIALTQEAHDCCEGKHDEGTKCLSSIESSCCKSTLQQFEVSTFDVQNQQILEKVFAPLLIIFDNEFLLLLSAKQTSHFVFLFTGRLFASGSIFSQIGQLRL
ncbi:MAG: hypothetical protein ACRC3G_06960 [Bacteroidales bacterium]